MSESIDKTEQETRHAAVRGRAHSYAFPCPPTSVNGCVQWGSDGMDLRAWLAGHALAGFAAFGSSPESAGKGAVAYADAVLRELGTAIDVDGSKLRAKRP